MKIAELYKLVEGTDTFFFTSADRDITYLTDVYSSVAVSRTNIESKNELSRANCELTFSVDNPVARRYMDRIIDNVISLTIFQQEDTDTFVFWKGRLTAVKPDGARLKLVFESIYTSMRRPGLRRRFQINCGHVHYGRGCNLDKEDFVVAAIATAFSGFNLTVPAAASSPAGFFSAGIVKAPDGTLRYIMNHTGEILTLIRPITTLNEAITASGDQIVSIYPGCDHSKTTCLNTFNNLNNNGGFSFIPKRNPFTGQSFS